MIDNAPESINEAIKILSYNDFLWDNVKPHPKDRKTVESLAGSQYTWTEKQGKLAVIIIKRYITKFEQHGIKVRRLCDSPVFAEPFRVINSQKAIEIIPEDVGIKSFYHSMYQWNSILNCTKHFQLGKTL